jgi:YlmC/YmxH family sporulation protein
MSRGQSVLDKEVINVRDGCRLGYVSDVLIDPECGMLKELLLPYRCGLFCMFKPDKEYRIPWCHVVRLGDDIILVDICRDEELKTCEDK